MRLSSAFIVLGSLVAVACTTSDSAAEQIERLEERIAELEGTSTTSLPEPATSAVVTTIGSDHISGESPLVDVDFPSRYSAVTYGDIVRAMRMGQRQAGVEPLVGPEDVEYVYEVIFNSEREDSISRISRLPYISRVELMAYIRSADEIQIEVTPISQSSNPRDIAWDLTRALASVSTISESDPAVNVGWLGPSLRLVVSGAQYRCSASDLNDIRQSRFSRSHFENRCRVS